MTASKPDENNSIAFPGLRPWRSIRNRRPLMTPGKHGVAQCGVTSRSAVDLIQGASPHASFRSFRMTSNLLCQKRGLFRDQTPTSIFRNPLTRCKNGAFRNAKSAPIWRKSRPFPSNLAIPYQRRIDIRFVPIFPNAWLLGRATLAHRIGKINRSVGVPAEGVSPPLRQSLLGPSDFAPRPEQCSVPRVPRYSG
jgi:hypothetical protein